VKPTADKAQPRLRLRRIKAQPCRPSLPPSSSRLSAPSPL
jgi:hypothetical protein